MRHARKEEKELRKGAKIREFVTGREFQHYDFAWRTRRGEGGGHVSRNPISSLSLFSPSCLVLLFPNVDTEGASGDCSLSGFLALARVSFRSFLSLACVSRNTAHFFLLDGNKMRRLAGAIKGCRAKGLPFRCFSYTAVGNRQEWLAKLAKARAVDFAQR